MLVAADLQRPNAVTQLQVVGQRAGLPVFAPQPGNGVGDPIQVARDSIDFARRAQHDMVIVDTAGRLGIDTEMMNQAAAIRDAVQPQEILFVVDAMVGQDAVNTAEAFRDGVGFTGVVLTKLDGDARGGAALSVRYVTGEPIMFASNGEKLEDFDVFHPDRMASRILGMGDMLTLIEQAERTFDQAEAEQMAAKLGTGNEFTLEDFLEQLQAIRRMGPISNLLGMLPGMGQMKEAISQVDDRDLDRTAAIIRSMTPAERDEPENDQRVPPASYRSRFRRLGQRGEQPRRPILRSPQDDAADGWRHGPAGRATEEHQVRERPQGQEGALRIGSRSHSTEDARRTSAGNRWYAGRPARWARLTRRRASAATAWHEDAGSEQAQTPQGVAGHHVGRSVRYDGPAVVVQETAHDRDSTVLKDARSRGKCPR